MMYLMVPLSVTVSVAGDQFEVARLVLNCRVNPVEGDGQEMSAVLVEVS